MNSLVSWFVRFLSGHHIVSHFQARGRRHVIALKQLFSLLWFRFILYLTFSIRRPALHHGRQEHLHVTVQQIKEKTTTLQSYYLPSFFVTLGYLQSALAEFIRPKPMDDQLLFTREYLECDDGGTVVLSWVSLQDPLMSPSAHRLADNSPILFVMPGLLGDDKSWYITNAVESVLQKETDHPWRVVVYVRRGCQIDLTEPKPQDFFDGVKPNSDLDMVLHHIRRRYPGAPMLGLGYSIGGNYLAGYVGSHANHPFSSCACVGNPFDVTGVSYNIEHNFKMVDYVLRKTKIDMVKRNRAILEAAGQGDMVERIEKATSYREQCDVYNRQLWEPNSTLNVYLDKSSCKNYISNIKVPFLFVSAKDDPVSHIQFLSYKEIEESPYCVACITNSGGHHAYLDIHSNAVPWCDRAVLEWLEASVEVLQL